MASMRALHPSVDTADLRRIVNAFDRRTLTPTLPSTLSTHKASYCLGCFTRLYGTHEVAGQRYYDRPYSHLKHNDTCIVCGSKLRK